MIDDDPDAASVGSLETLLRLAPDPERARRVRVRCRTRLQRSQRRPARLPGATGRASRLLTAVVVGGFCVIYAAALVATTLRLEEILR